MDEGLAHIFKQRQSKASLGTEVIGRKVLAYDLVTSTNDLCHFLAREGEPEGTVVFARSQTHGRGRHAKGWVSPQGGLYFSFILRPDIEAERASRITLMTGWAMARALQELGVSGVSIKWPNDVLVEERKVCGILTEMNLTGGKVDYVVVGVGLNVNIPASELPDGAGSLASILNRTFDIADLVHVILKELDQGYRLLSEQRFRLILDDLRVLSLLFLGSHVKITNGEREVTGYAVDFDEDGGLIVRGHHGTQERVASGSLEIL